MTKQIPSSNNFAKNQPGLLITDQVIPIKYIDTNGATNGQVIAFNSTDNQAEWTTSGAGGGVTQILAGTGISVNNGGVGIVTVTNTTPGITYGGAVTGGHNKEILYIDNTGNLTSDAQFTRDSTTHVTTFEVIGAGGGLVQESFDSQWQTFLYDPTFSVSNTELNLTSSFAMLRWTDIVNGLHSGISPSSTGLQLINNNGIADTTWKWPTIDGAASNVIITDGAGNLSFAPAGGTPSWLLAGNTVGAPGSFLGTIDNFPLDFRQNNQTAGHVDGTLGITFFGPNAGSGNTGAGNIVAVGQGSAANNSGAAIAVLGNQAAANNQGDRVSALGQFALSGTNTGVNVVAIGYEAVSGGNTGNFVVGIGTDAAVVNSGTSVIAIGTNTLFHNTASNTVAIGDFALSSTNTGDNNTAVGFQSLLANTAGFQNTAVGRGTLTGNTVGQDNVAVGYRALIANTSGAYNTAIGSNALPNNNGDQNVAIGRQALNTNTSGDFNVAVGASALQANDTTSNNTAVGWASLLNSTGHDETAVGYKALFSLTTGLFNTAVGSGTLQTNSTAHDNTAVGAGALTNTTGGENTAIGNGAGDTNTTGTFNTFLGFSTDPSAGGFTGSTAVGTFAQFGADYSLVLGGINGVNGATHDTKVGIGTTTPAGLLDVAHLGNSYLLVDPITTDTYGLGNPFTNNLEETTYTTIMNSLNATFSSIVFAGTGGNDMTFAPDNGYTHLTPLTYTVTIDSLLILYGTLVGLFTDGETITQTTGAGAGSTAVIFSDDGGTSMYVMSVVPVGPGFQVGETIQGGTSGATAVIGTLLDTYTWTDTLTTTNLVIITGFIQDLSFGVKIQWGSSVGHVIGDTFTFTATPLQGVFLQQTGTRSLTQIGDVSSTGHHTVFTISDLNQLFSFNRTVQIADGTQGVGKVLTSDSVGVSSWQFAGKNNLTLLGKLIGADMNTTADQIILLNGGTTYLLKDMVVTNSSTALIGVDIEIWTGTSRTGTEEFGGGNEAQLAAPDDYLDTFTSGLTTKTTFKTTTIPHVYASITTPQGAPATADIYIYGYIIN